ncbi:hypothetical protein [Amycolatopsis suaedae]|uniref:Uncharacterized protein n=1 Tax=Amycolatopsis suaedae TaxID=2510978 RepID=A0A4Q7JDW8_9PSEU|nr:hypothetical protein [Amycolatopsis suaedae]RZQ65226.1 hypothetical protein EWH70_04880 [Amycolatopsis suaedae]
MTVENTKREEAVETVEDPTTPPPTPPDPDGNWEPNGGRPVGPTGNWEPNGTGGRPALAPMGNWEPNSPPAPGPAPIPTGNWEPNSPPVQVAPVPQNPDGWVRNRAITHLYSYNAAPGVWVYVQGAGWKRLSPASDSGHSHLTMLAAIAKNHRLPVDYHEDSQGQIDQLVV